MNDQQPAKPATPESELALIDDRGDFAIITINRPEKRNAMSPAAMRQLRAAFAQLQEKKVIILTGTGPSFCAGVDLSASIDTQGNEKNKPSSVLNAWTQVQADIRNHRAIFIAAVNGYALGGGSTLINNSTLAIAAESATIGLPEMGFGGWPMQAGPAATKRLASKHAAEMIFTARRVDAQTAYRMALVNSVVPDDKLMEEAIALAEHIAQFDAIALDYGKKAFQKIESLDWDDAMDYSEYTSIITRSKSTSSDQGMAAFLAGKRATGQGA